MAKVQYRGLSHFREVSAKDFESAGLEGVEGIKVARFDISPIQNRDEVPVFVEMTDEQLKLMQRLEPGNWRTVSDEKAAQLEEEQGDGEEVEVEMPAPDTGGAARSADASASASSDAGSAKTASAKSAKGRA